MILEQLDHVVVGKIKRPHGLFGAVEVAPYTDYPERFKSRSKLNLAPPLSYGLLTVETATSIGKRLVVKFKEISTIDQAKELNGCLLQVPLGERVSLPEGAFWVEDILGLDVYLTDGELLGQVKEIIRTGGNDVYVVRPAQNKDQDKNDLLIPATKEIVKKVDLTNKRITVEPIPGLIPHRDENED